MPQFTAIGFDLFNTLVHCDYGALPSAVIGGKVRPTTLPNIVRVLAAAGHDVEMDRLAAVALSVSREQEAEKLRTGREFPSSYRWAAILAELDITPEPSVLEAVVQSHMDTMCAAWDISAEDRAALDRLSERYALALLSNFDHGPSERQLLERIGIAAHFRYVGISDELGWRKPEARVFQDMLGALEVEPEACLFVGDSIEFDMAGAQAVGMAAAWIAKADAVYTPDVAPPVLRATNIAALAPLLLSGTTA